MQNALTVAGSPSDVASRLDRLPVGSWHTRARLILGASTFFDAFDLLAISFALPAFMEAWAMTPAQVGLVISAAFFGQLFGALAAGVLAERFGRLAIANLTIALFSVMSLACAFATGPGMLVVLRFIQGIGLGGEVPIATTYVVEIAPAQARGRFYLAYQIVFIAGLVAAGLIGTALVPVFGWQAMFYIGALPALLVLVLRRALPESPRWLASRGRCAEADAILRRVERETEQAGVVLPPIVRQPAPPEGPAGAGWREMFSRFYRPRTLCVWAMWFCCSSTTYGLTTWLPTLYRTEFHLPLQRALFYGLVTGIAGILGAALCAVLIDRIGRRLWFNIGFFAGGAVLLAMLVAGVSSAVLLLAFVSVATFFLISVAVALNLYTPELYPTRIRAVASSVGGAWQRVAAGVGPIVVGALLPAFGLGSVFLYFGGLALVGGVVTVLFAPETTGRRLEDVSP